MKKLLECLASAVQCRRKADEARSQEARANYLESMHYWLGLADYYENNPEDAPPAVRMANVVAIRKIAALAR